MGVEILKPQQSLMKHKKIITTINNKYGDMIAEINSKYGEMLNNIDIQRAVLYDIHSSEIKRLKAILKINDTTPKLIESIVGSMFQTKAKALNINRRYKHSVEMREVYCFIAYLFFGIKSQWLADRFEVTRQVIHHYCKNVIDKYEVYPSFKASIDTILPEEEVKKMISLFSKKKRKHGKKKEKCPR